MLKFLYVTLEKITFTCCNQ